MTDYRFLGELDQGRIKTPFERTIEANSLTHAREKLYSQIGSEHSVTKGKIEILEEEEA
jgi:ribosomal protein L20A (L18A)